MSELSVSDFRKYLDVIVGKHRVSFDEINACIVDFSLEAGTYHNAMILVEIIDDVRIRDSRELEKYGCDGVKFESYSPSTDELYLTVDSNEGKLGFQFVFV